MLPFHTKRVLLYRYRYLSCGLTTVQYNIVKDNEHIVTRSASKLGFEPQPLRFHIKFCICPSSCPTLRFNITVITLMTLQRPNIIQGETRFNPRTSASEIWCTETEVPELCANCHF